MRKKEKHSKIQKEELRGAAGGFTIASPSSGGSQVGSGGGTLLPGKKPMPPVRKP